MQNSHLYILRRNFYLSRICILFTLSFLFHTNLWSQADSSFYYTNKLLRESPTSKDSLKTCIRFMKYWQNNANYKNVAIYAEMGLKLAHSLRDSTSFYVADAYIGLGIACMRTMKSDQALSNFIKAEKLLIKDPYRLTFIQLQRGLIFYFNQDYTHALEIFRSVEKKAIELKKTYIEALALMDIGNIFFERFKADSALKYYDKSLHTPKAEELSDSTLYMSLYMNIGNVYSSIMKHEKAKPYLLEAYRLIKKYNRKSSLPIITYNLSSIEFYLKENANASEHLKQSIQYANLINDKRNLLFAYKFKLRLDSAMGLKDSFYKDFVLYNNLNDTLRSSELFGKMAEMQTKYDVDKKDNEIILLNKDKDLQDEKLKKQRIITTLVLIGLLIFTLLSIVLYRNYRAKNHANRLLEIQKVDIENKRQLLAIKNEKIEDSIMYAKRIQEAILPADLFLTDEVKDYFVYYLPKDVVSGDFYWRYLLGNDLFFAVADCTGHGVPGAMMSMLGYDLLEHAVKDKKLKEPADILTFMNTQIIEKLYKSNPDGAKDGMDITLCKLDLISKKLTYSGAKNDLYLVSYTEVEILSVDKHSIGYQNHVTYTQANHVLSSATSVYLFTDGYCDQKGGPENKKYMKPKFKKLLQEIHNLSCAEQKEKIQATFLAWKGEHAQRDDILVVGFRV